MAQSVETLLKIPFTSIALRLTNLFYFLDRFPYLASYNQQYQAPRYFYSFLMRGGWSVKIPCYYTFTCHFHPITMKLLCCTVVVLNPSLTYLTK